MTPENVVPFGPGGEALGMTRGEMIEHARSREEEQQAILDAETDFVFAWLVAMYFVGSRLSKRQFLVAAFFFTLITANKCMNLILNIESAERWWAFAGARVMDFAEYAPALERGIRMSMDPVLVFSAAVFLWVGCIWWGVICRRQMPVLNRRRKGDRKTWELSTRKVRPRGSKSED